MLRYTAPFLEVGSASGVSNVVDLDTVTRVDVGVDLNRLEDPDIGYAFLDQNFVHHIRLVNRIEDVGRRLGSELCGTDEQHRDNIDKYLRNGSIFK